MIKEIVRCFKTKELLLLILLMVILVRVHSLGMVTLLAAWCLFFILAVPFHYYKGRLLPGILIFTFLYGSFGLLSGFMTLSKLIGLCLPLSIFYILGKFIVIRVRKPVHLILLVAILLICYQLDVFCSFLYSLLTEGYTLSNTRIFYLGADENRALTATLVGLNVSVSMVGLSSSVILKGYNKLRLLYFLLFLMAILTTTYLLNRTGLVICLICTIVVLCYYYQNNRKMLIGIFAFMALILVLALNLGWIGSDILMAYGERNVDIQTAGMRTVKWSEALSELFRHPLGWAEGGSETVYYAHNMWLDIAKVTGVMPFLALLLVSVQAMIAQLRLLKIKSDSFIAVTTGLNICFFLSCFVEPVYGGVHLFLWMMLWGMQEQYYNQNYRNKVTCRTPVTLR